MGASPVYQDEFACEEAIEKLSECCDPDEGWSRLSCYRGRDCDSREPDISQGRSERIRELSCDEIARAGYCQQPADRNLDGGAR
jgi:hypothetical protein